MMKKKLVACLSSLLLCLLAIQPVLAQTVIPTVGRNCRASWGAVTTDTDGGTIPPGVITYNFYIQTNATPSPIPGVTTPAIANIAGPSATPCIALIATGTYHSWVTAFATWAGGSVSESELSNDFVFKLVVPNKPILMVK